MARSRANGYDDYDNKVSRRGNSSSKVLLAVILLSIVICAVAVLCWVRILETQEISQKGSQNLTRTPDNAADSIVVDSTPAVPETVQNSVSSVLANAENSSVSLKIDDGLGSLSSEESSYNFITSADYSLPDTDSEDQISEQGIEMKKPLIAQNLSISQQSSFSKDMVRYQEYTIKEGDSLVSIAESFGLVMQTLISVNQITSPSSLFIGSTLQIPDRDGTLYTVRENDTLLSITQQYGLSISAKTLGDINGVRDDGLKVGQKLFIPYETLEATGTIETPSEQSFDLPSSGTTVGMYNQKVPNPLTDGPMQLDGILIQSQAGDAVCASESGTVIDKGFNSNGSGFVKVMHLNGYITFYDYLADICVETTDKVEKGQVLGYFGSDTTNLLTPTVFFRIEQDGMALDPYSFF